jgi:hypothetical protein
MTLQKAKTEIIDDIVAVTGCSRNYVKNKIIFKTEPNLLDKEVHIEGKFRNYIAFRTIIIS